jgi:hypothetical protein
MSGPMFDLIQVRRILKSICHKKGLHLLALHWLNYGRKRTRREVVRQCPKLFTLNEPFYAGVRCARAGSLKCLCQLSVAFRLLWPFCTVAKSLGRVMTTVQRLMETWLHASTLETCAAAMAQLG